MPEAPKHKLAAIMFTDMEGYTALMQEDEPKARELIEYQREILKRLVTKHEGEVLQYVGDGTFCKFGSAIEAVNAAIDIQHVFEIEEEVNLRIGIHIGDVVSKGKEVYGDGVNIASRLESLAKPGGICVSSEVYGLIKNQPDIHVTSGGSKELKNVKDPLDIYFISASTGEKGSTSGERAASEKSIPRKYIYSGVAVMALLLVVLWNLPFFSSGNRLLEASGEIRSIAVLPLANMSNDPAQEYFSDGMTEALISGIAKIRSLKVISRTSVMRYKGTDKSLPEIARELKVDAILEGSVMHAEGEVRITAQLIRASTDEHLWANSYTDKLENILSLQSKIARAIANEIKLTLSPEEEMNIGGERKVNPEAYKLYLQARKVDPWVQSFEDQEEAIKLLEEAVAIDENFIDAWILISDRFCIFQSLSMDRNQERVSKARQALEKAKELDPTMIEVQLAEGHFHYYGNKDYSKALESYYRVLRNDPNNSVALEHVGYVQRRIGKWVASLDNLLEVYKSDPYNADLVRSIADTYFNLRNFIQSEIFFRKALDISPKFTHPYVGLSEIAFQVSGNPGNALTAMATENKVNDFAWYLSVKSYYLALSGDLDAALETISSVPKSEFQSGPVVNVRNFHLGRIHRIVGQHAKADKYFNSLLPDLETSYRLEPKKDKWMWFLSFAYAYTGRKEEAISVVQSRVENLSISDDTFLGAIIEFEAAQVYTIVGEYDKALDKVELLLSIPSPMSVETLEAFPVWESLHDLPRYKEIVKKFGPQA